MIQPMSDAKCSVGRYETGIYLVFVEDCVEPEIMGPYINPDARDAAAHKLRRERGDNHGIYMLDLDLLTGAPYIVAYSGKFFEEDDRT